MTDPAPTGPLSGLRIVELSSYVATPLCGLTLRQLGADVVRVEPLAGAPDRSRMPRSEEGTSLYFSGLNQGKRALSVDMSRQEGRDLVADLICGTGAPEDDPGGAIVVANSERYADLCYPALSQRRPDLVYALLTGRRDGGSAVDYAVQATTGFAMLTGPAERTTPTNTVVPAWDIAAGLYLATGLLAGVHGRRETGRGSHVKLALEDIAFSAAGMLGYLAEAQLIGIDRGPSGNEVYGTYGRDFVTEDGVRFMLIVLTNSHWRRLLEATGLTDVMASVATALGADFSDESERYRCRQVISSLLGDWFSRHPWSEVQPMLAGTRALHSAYQTFDDLAADDAAQLRANPLFTELTQPGAGTYQAPGAPLRVDEQQVPAAPTAVVGQHNDEVAAGLGLDPDRIVKLREEGILG